MGASPLYTLGVAYLDENLKAKVSPQYLGQYHFVNFIQIKI